jgi:hypothetical protein
MENTVPYEKHNSFANFEDQNNNEKEHDITKEDRNMGLEGRISTEGLDMILLEKVNVGFSGIKAIQSVYYIPSIDKFGTQTSTERETQLLTIVDSHELRTKYNLKYQKD